MNDTAKSTAKRTASDSPPDHWIDHILPPYFRPYARLARIDRPIGTWLLLLPCWWGSALATATEMQGPNLWHFMLFSIGAIVMRSAGCTWNDILDRNYDGQVARTATRPIPSGAVSVRQAVVFLILQLLSGLAVLSTFNPMTIAVGTASLILIAIYPLMKRITYWPQAFLGLTFNWGALVGWTAITGSLDAPALWLYAAGIAWTLGYDTIYAHQDKEDDAMIGIKSTALKFGDNTRPWLWGFYAATAGLLTAAGWAAGLGWPYYTALAVGAGHLVWQLVTIDIDSPDDCRAKFHANRFFGFIVLAGMIAG